MDLETSTHPYVGPVADVPCYASAKCHTVYSRRWPARGYQDIVDLMRRLIIVGVSQQRSSFRTLKVSIVNNQSTGISKRTDQAVRTHLAVVHHTGTPNPSEVILVHGCRWVHQPIARHSE